MRAPERRVRILRGHEDQPRDMRFSDDGRRLASVSHDGQLIVWDVVDRRSRSSPTDTFEVGLSVDFSPDGRRVYTGGDDATLRTWDLYGDQQFLRRMFALRGGAGLHRRPRVARRQAAGLPLVRLARELGPFPRHRHGNEDARESPR